jgi:hypothetical protein
MFVTNDNNILTIDNKNVSKYLISGKLYKKDFFIYLENTISYEPNYHKKYSGKIMFFKTQFKGTYEYADFISNRLNDIANKYKLRVKFNSGVAILYLDINDHSFIKSLMEVLSQELKSVLYFKMDYQTITDAKYKNKNYVFSSTRIQDINRAEVDNILNTFNL